MIGTGLLVAWLASAPAMTQDAPGSIPIAADREPAPPAEIAESFVPPDRDATGVYLTPNRGLTAAETTWHVWVALNVAALGCRGADEAAMVAGYNAMLAAERVPLAAASDGTAAAYRARFGAAWQGRTDDDMTRLYNFWAQTGGHAAFCATAAAVLREAAAVDPDAFAAFAATAMPRLEAPFLASFAAFDDWRRARAAWRAAHAPQVVIATIAPVAPVAATVVAAPQPPVDVPPSPFRGPEGP